jgi:hypothetical protein
MKKRWWVVSGLLLLLPLALLAGCTAGGAYQGSGSADAYSSPVFQGTDPALRQWYTAPYFNPYEMP